MKTLNYEKVIHAPIPLVWKLLWDAESYKEWTQFFGTGSEMKSDWKIGGKTYFVDAENNGLVATITALREPEEVIFSHLGYLKNGVENIKGEEVEEWSGAEEKYFLRAIDENTTELRVVTHVISQYEEMMNDGFNKGLDLLKKLAEN